MHLYRVINVDRTPERVLAWYPARDAAHEHMRRVRHEEVRIELVEFDVGRASLLAALNDIIAALDAGLEGHRALPHEVAEHRRYIKVLRTWTRGARGGLIECQNGD